MKSENRLRETDTAEAGRIPARYRVVRRALPVLSPGGGLVALREPYAPPRRDYKKIIGAVFLAALLILIFFSRTIYGYNLPVVTATKPENGRLRKQETSSGIADWAAVENLYAVVGGQVEEVLVKEGDAVTEGQELFRLRFDRDETERKLRELQNSRRKLQADIENIHLKLEKQNRYLDDLNGETYKEETFSTYDLDALLIDINKARAELRDVRERYDEGEAEEMDVNRARYSLQSLYLKQEELERKLAEQQEAAKEAVEDQEKIRDSKRQDYEADIASLELDLEMKSIEANGLSIQEEPYRKALEEFEAYATVTAPIAGSVISLGAGKGESIRAEQLIASVGAAGDYELECSVSLENNFVLPGDAVELTNSSRTVEGTVTKITPTAQNKTVTIALDADDVTAGETFDVTFRKNSDTLYTLVPNGALGQDSDGYFVNLVKRRDGILGQEYYLERLDVYVGDSDADNTVITQGIRFFEPIALSSDKPVEPGDVIALSNPGDFFED